MWEMTRHLGDNLHSYFKILPTCQLELFWVSNSVYMSSIIVIISNITMLVSYNVICFEYFIPMRHCANKKAPPILIPHPSHSAQGFQLLRNTLLTFFFSD